MSTLEKRVERLEGRTGTADDGPPYVAFPTLEEYAAWVAEYDGPPVKTYVGVSPDDWPGKQEKDR